MPFSGIAACATDTACRNAIPRKVASNARFVGKWNDSKVGRECGALRERAGVFAIVLEAMPREVAKVITDEISVPTLGIGAGPDCDGQVLVLNDILGLTFRRPAKFVRRYMDGAAQIKTALSRFKADVEEGICPSDTESYHLSEEAILLLPEIVSRIRMAKSSQTE